jgi:hypothetical protein
MNRNTAVDNYALTIYRSTLYGHNYHIVKCIISFITFYYQIPEYNETLKFYRFQKIKYFKKTFMYRVTDEKHLIVTFLIFKTVLKTLQHYLIQFFLTSIFGQSIFCQITLYIFLFGLMKNFLLNILNN